MANAEIGQVSSEPFTEMLPSRDDQSCIATPGTVQTEDDSDILSDEVFIFVVVHLSPGFLELLGGDYGTMLSRVASSTSVDMLLTGGLTVLQGVWPNMLEALNCLQKKKEKLTARKTSSPTKPSEIFHRAAVEVCPHVLSDLGKKATRKLKRVAKKSSVEIKETEGVTAMEGPWKNMVKARKRVQKLLKNCHHMAAYENEGAPAQQEPTGTSNPDCSNASGTNEMVCNSESKGELPSTLLNTFHVFAHPDDAPLPVYVADPLPVALDDLQSRLLNHATQQVSQCGLCGMDFSNPRMLKEHVLRHSNWFTCNFCSSDVKTLARVAVHHRLHAAHFPFVCDICEMGLKSKDEVEEHKARHDAADDCLACYVCNKRFGKVIHLKQHALTHTRYKTYPCKLCARVFFRKSELDEHAQYHKLKHKQSYYFQSVWDQEQDLTRRFLCEFCGRRFRRSFEWKKHDIRHIID